jgi:AcrR family transcriptional regulator
MASSSPTPRTLSTAEERRESILEAAQGVFAARGLHGTPTMEIAKAAGISQAYLFRLFPRKSELYIALVRRCNERIQRTFVDAAAEARAAGEEVLPAMGRAYIGLLADRELLRESEADPEQVREFFAHGMLLNALAAMRAEDSDAHWAQVLLGPAKPGC